MNSMLDNLAVQIKNLRRGTAATPDAVAMLEHARGLPDAVAVAVAEVTLRHFRDPSVLQAVADLRLPPYDPLRVPEELAVLLENDTGEPAFWFLGYALDALLDRQQPARALIEGGRVHTPALALLLVRSAKDPTDARRLGSSLFHRNGQLVPAAQAFVTQRPWIEPALVRYRPRRQAAAVWLDAVWSSRLTFVVTSALLAVTLVVVCCFFGVIVANMGERLENVKVDRAALGGKWERARQDLEAAQAKVDDLTRQLTQDGVDKIRLEGLLEEAKKRPHEAEAAESALRKELAESRSALDKAKKDLEACKNTSRPPEGKAPPSPETTPRKGVASFALHQGHVTGLGPLPDGKAFVSAASDGSVVFSDLNGTTKWRAGVDVPPGGSARPASCRLPPRSFDRLGLLDGSATTWPLLSLVALQPPGLPPRTIAADLKAPRQAPDEPREPGRAGGRNRERPKPEGTSGEKSAPTQPWVGHAALAVSPDGSLWMTGDTNSTDRVVVVGEVGTGKVKYRLKCGLPHQVMSLQFQENDPWVVTMDWNTTWLWNAAGTEGQWKGKPFDMKVTTACTQPWPTLSPNAEYLFANHYPDLAIKWAWPRGTHQGLKIGQTFATVSPAPNEEVAVAAFSADGKVLVGGGTKGGVFRWDVLSGKELARFSHTAGVDVVAVGPDGKRVAAAADKTVRIWQDGQLASWQCPERVRSLAFSPRDDHTLLIGDGAGSVHVWTLEK
jgi:hypothetical protein